MKKPMLPAILAICAGLAIAAPAQADEKVTLDQVPAKVKETIQKHVQNGKIDEIEKEHRKTGVVYEVEYTTADGVEYEIDVAEDGKLLNKKRE